MRDRDPELEVADEELGVERKRWPLWKILVVVAIAAFVPCVVLTGLLAAIVVPKANQELVKAKQAKARADIMAISTAIELHVMAHDGTYPESLGVIEIGDLRDPWGNPYFYEPPAPGSSDFRVATYGADGRPGGQGPERDLDNVMIRDGDF